MIRRCDGDKEPDVIFPVIDDAGSRIRVLSQLTVGKSRICQKEHLRHEMDAGIVFWGVEEKVGKLGLVGIQDVQDVTLIRHADVLTSQWKSLRKGIIPQRCFVKSG